MEKDLSKLSEEVVSKKNLVYLFKLILIFLVYFLTAKIGLKFDAVSGFATFVWPPSGIALATIFLMGRNMWPAIFFGAFFVNLTTGAPILVAIGIALGNTLEALVAVYFLRKFGFDGNQKNLRNVLLFIVFGAVLNTIIAATIGVASLFLGGVIPSVDITKTWVAWYIGDALGALIVGNLILTCAHGLSIRKFGFVKFFELVSFFILVCIFNLTVFIGLFGYIAPQPNDYVLSYLIFLFLIWASIRFGSSVSAVTVFITFLITTWSAVVDSGPFTAPLLSTRLFLLQGYISIISVTGMILAAVIAERFSVEEDLLAEKNKDEAILESVGEGVVVIDIHGRVIFINHAAQIMLHITDDEAIGHDYEKIVRIESVKGTPVLSKARPFNEALASSNVVSGTYYFIRSDGVKFPVSLTTAPIILGYNTVGVIDVFRDVTREMDVDRAKSEFVSLASHQLRTPLTTMKWYSHSLLDQNTGVLSSKQREYIKEIYHNNQRMIELVNALLNVSRIELGTFIIKPVPTNIEDVAREVIHDLKVPAEAKEISIKAEYEEALPLVNLDPDLMRIILQNLLGNGVEYSKKDSTVRLSVLKKDKEIIISVKDTGCGIPASEQDKIFTKLFRAENAKAIDPDGNGLGLYIVKSIVDTVGGRIWFISEVQKGTIFHVALPLSGMMRRETGPKLVYTL